jgi:acyl transferase domain-containing protein
MGSSWSLLEELAKNKEESNVDHPWLAQPACTAIQVALADLLLSWGVRPTRVVGHSSGEIAAAAVAGKLDRTSALKAAYFRGVVSSRQTSKEGAMLAAGLSEEALQPFLDRVNNSHPGALGVACMNSPRNCTVSGDDHKVNMLRDALDAASIFARKLNVKKAYHSSHMRELSAEYAELLGQLAAPDASPFGKVHMFSTVTGEMTELDVLGPDYWVENLISAVKFSQAMTAACFERIEKGQALLRTESNAANVFADVVLELGPHGALQSAIKDIVSSRAEGAAITSLPTLSRTQPGPEVILNALGHLWCRGFPIDVQQVNQSWDIFHPTEDPNLLVQLPGYAFNHSQKFWYESRLSRNYRLRKERRHDLFGAPVADWDVENPRWRNIIRLSEQPWLRDHIVTNSHVYPGVGYVIMAIEAARQIADQQLTVVGFRVRDVVLKRALIVPDNKDGIETSISMHRDHESSTASSTIWRRFQIASYNTLGDDWQEHCTGYISIDYDVATGPIDDGREVREEAEGWRRLLLEVQARSTENWDISQAYENMATVGLKFGPLFRNGSACRGERKGPILGTVTIPDIAQAMPKGHISPHLIHPATMDSMIHFALGSIMNLSGKMNLEAAMVSGHL